MSVLHAVYDSEREADMFIACFTNYDAAKEYMNRYCAHKPKMHFIKPITRDEMLTALMNNMED